MPVLTADGEALVLDAIAAWLTSEAITLYATLTTTSPTKSAAGTGWTAPSNGDRVEIELAIDGDEFHNLAVDFGLAGADETYIGIEIWDAATTGTRLIYDDLTEPLDVVTDQPIIMLAGAFKFSPDANA